MTGTADPARCPSRSAARRGAGPVLLLGSLSAFAPMSIDLYLPALPTLAGRFGVGESDIQLTLTACLAGLAVGQLLAGPCSDALGRRGPLLAGLAVYVAASLGCAVAPTAGALTGLRLVQGLAGAAGVVIARAIVRDLYSGVEMARFLSLLMLVNGMAPILAPVLGGQLLRVLPWQGLFVVLAGYGLALLVSAAFWLRETLPPSARHRDGLGAALRAMGGLLVERRFAGYVLAGSLSAATLFCYIGASPFVLQEIYRLSPQGFGLVFAANGLGIVLLGQLNRALVHRVSPRRMCLAGAGLAVLGGAEMLVAALAGLPLPAVLVGMFAVVASGGLLGPNTTALALSGRPRAGSASAVLGTVQFLGGAAAAPLAGALYTGTAVPLAALMCGFSVAALLVLLPLSGRLGGSPTP
ncbi:multidrug effflux MFS transporter [Pseudonocardia acaciae]|uniref:multidrug effflux MFS transporter n=1 Tax=Pseudonocardia acaciae TaxID=551276 RepID=UPI00048D974D|nr:multidrug effflux MFS transporter [Pseudonocardia acaciae]